jgi:hypothetical protein
MARRQRLTATAPPPRLANPAAPTTPTVKLRKNAKGMACEAVPFVSIMQESIMPKRKAAGKPNNNQSPLSPPPPRTTLATPEQLAAIIVHAEALIAHLRRHEETAAALQHAPLLPGILAFNRSGLAVLPLERLLGEIGFHPGNLGGPSGQFPADHFEALTLLYTSLLAARLSRNVDTPEQRQECLRTWGAVCNGGWRWVQGESLPGMGELLPPLELAVRRLRECAAPATPVSLSPPQQPPPEIIYHLRDLIYRVGDGRPNEVSNDENAILQAFLERPAMSEGTFQRVTGNTDARTILIRLLKKYDGTFAAAIQRPISKSSGGYYAIVRKAEQS